MRVKLGKGQTLPPLDPQECQCHLVWANERVVEPEFLQARLQAAGIAVGWLVLQGEARVSDALGRARAPAGPWLFPGRADGEQRFQPGSRILSVRFAFRNRGGDEVICRDRHVVVPARSCPELEKRARVLVRAVRPWTRRGSLLVGRDQIPLDENLEIEAAFHLWLAAYAGAMVRLGATLSIQSVEEPRVRKALALIEQHPLSRRFRVSELARECGLGVNRLGALFHQATGHTPLAHYDSLRLERAQHLLAEVVHLRLALCEEDLIHEIHYQLSMGLTDRDVAGADLFLQLLRQLIVGPL